MHIAEDKFHEYHDNSLKRLKFIPKRDDQLNQFDLSPEIGSGYIKRYVIRKGLEWIIANYHMHENKAINSFSDLPVIELCFCLSGSTGSHSINSSDCLIKENRSLLLLMKEMSAECVIDAKINMNICKLRLMPEVFNEYLQKISSNPVIDFSTLTRGTKSLIFQETMSPAIGTIVRQMLMCPVPPPYQQMYMEGKVLELMAVYFHQHFLGRRADEGTIYFSRTDTDKFYRAKAILAERMENPPSIKEIACEAGINEFKLKKGFKELFGTTMYGYVREQRLEKARVLLEQGELSVMEIVTLVGYSNPSHFAESFRIKYGVNPGKYMLHNN